MEYRFRSKKSWDIPPKVIVILWLAWNVSNYFSKKNFDNALINIPIFILCIVFIGFFYRDLSQKIILTISEAGITYSGKEYIFPRELKNIPSEQLSKILIADYEPVGLRERWFTPRIWVLDQHGKYIKDLSSRRWNGLDNVDLEQALKISFTDKVEFVNRSKILEMVNKHLNADGLSELGKVAGYFAYASAGLMFICVALAFLDSNTTIAWGQYKYLIWGIALTIAAICLTILVRAKTNFVALVIVPLIFTSVMTYLIHQSLMLLNFHFGEQKSYSFEKVVHNKDFEVWRAASGETVECISSPSALHDYKIGIVRVGMLGIVRTRFKEVCKFPLEKKKGKAT